MIELHFPAEFDPRYAAGSVWYTFAGVRSGPFQSRGDALEDMLLTISAWQVEARKVGGFVTVVSPLLVVVCMPFETTNEVVLAWPRRRSAQR